MVEGLEEEFDLSAVAGVFLNILLYLLLRSLRGCNLSCNIQYKRGNLVESLIRIILLKNLVILGDNEEGCMV